MDKKTCPCGRSYWPNQAWMHKDCVANTVVNTEQMVVNESHQVVNRSKDRHKPRKEYMRQYMRNKRKGIS